MKRVKMWFVVVGALYCVLSLCRAQDFNCTVAQNQDGVIYRISDESRPTDYKASECSYVWINATGHTIATNVNKIPVLMKSSINKLMASRCIENIVCRQHCKSETTGFRKDFMAICTMSCTRNNSSLGDNRDLIHGNKDGWPGFCIWIITVIIIVIVLIGLGFLFKKKISQHMQLQTLPICEEAGHRSITTCVGVKRSGGLSGWGLECHHYYRACKRCTIPAADHFNAPPNCG